MTMERTTRTRLTTAAILVLVLGTGVVLGMAVGPRFTSGDEASEMPSRRGESPRDERPQEGQSRRRPLIVEQVGLTEVQQTQVDSIVSAQRTRMRALQKEFDEAYMPRYRALLEETREAIRVVLTADQRTAYDSLLAEHDRRMEERRRNGSRNRPRG